MRPRRETELGGIHGFLNDKALGLHGESCMGSQAKQDAGHGIVWGFG